MIRVDDRARAAMGDRPYEIADAGATVAIGRRTGKQFAEGRDLAPRRRGHFVASGDTAPEGPIRSLAFLAVRVHEVRPDRKVS